MVKYEKGEWVVYSEKGKRYGGYATKALANKRIAQMEYFKLKNNKAFKKIAKKVKSEFSRLKDNKMPLDEVERKEVFKRDAVWHYAFSKDPNTGKKVRKVSAVWKSKNPKTGKVTFVTNTHRAFNTAPTLAGAIGKYHSFIKKTASEIFESDNEHKNAPAELDLKRHLTKNKSEFSKTKIPTSEAILRLSQEFRRGNWGKSNKVGDSMQKEVSVKTAKYFIAADIPTSVERDISHRVNPDSLHVTLAYLGNKSPEELEKIKRFLAKKSRKDWKDTVLDSEEYKRFNPSGIPHRTIEDNSRLKEMVEDLNRNALTRSQSRWARNYKPHVTVGFPKNVPKLFNDKPIAIPVKTLGLYRIVNSGKYNLVKDFDLQERTWMDKFLDFVRG